MNCAYEYTFNLHFYNKLHNSFFFGLAFAQLPLAFPKKHRVFRISDERISAFKLHDSITLRHTVALNSV